MGSAETKRSRREIAAEAAKTQEAYRRGEVHRGSVEDLMKELEEEE